MYVLKHTRKGCIIWRCSKATMLKCPKTIYTNIEKSKILKIGTHFIFIYIICIFFRGFSISLLSRGISRYLLGGEQNELFMSNSMSGVHSPAGVYTFSVWSVAADHCIPGSWIDGVSCHLRTCRAGTARKSRPFCKCSSYGYFEKKTNKLVTHVIWLIPYTIHLCRGGDSTTPPFASLFFSFCL